MWLWQPEVDPPGQIDSDPPACGTKGEDGSFLRSAHKHPQVGRGASSTKEATPALLIKRGAIRDGLTTRRRTISMLVVLGR